MGLSQQLLRRYRLALTAAYAPRDDLTRSLLRDRKDHLRLGHDWQRDPRQMFLAQRREDYLRLEFLNETVPE